jgi:hypothetical protein
VGFPGAAGSITMASGPRRRRHQPDHGLRTGLSFQLRDFRKCHKISAISGPRPPRSKAHHRRADNADSWRPSHLQVAASVNSGFGRISEINLRSIP